MLTYVDSLSTHVYSCSFYFPLPPSLAALSDHFGPMAHFAPSVCLTKKIKKNIKRKRMGQSDGMVQT